MNGKILMVIAHKDFRDEEYFIPLDFFRKNDFEVVTASSTKKTATGVLGGEAEIDINIEDIEVEDFRAIVFSGGGGAAEYFESEKIHEIINRFNDKKKVVAAICIAPVILAKAGILKGKSATVWQNNLNKTGVKALEEANCKVSNQNVQKDENIITANGPEAAENFAKKIIEALQER